MLNKISPFEQGYDLFSDGSVFAIALPGHAKGQYGVVFQDQNNETVFLCADACWSMGYYKTQSISVKYLIKVRYMTDCTIL